MDNNNKRSSGEYRKRSSGEYRKRSSGEYRSTVSSYNQDENYKIEYRHPELKKHFVPFKTPRYLAGQVKKVILLKDLRLYNEHRYKIFTAQPKIDCKPPHMPKARLLRLDKLNKDYYALKRINEENRKLMMKINTINRLHGLTVCFNPRANLHTTRWPAYEQRLKQIQVENIQVYKRIMAKTSNYNTKLLNKQWKRNYERMTKQARFPFSIEANKTLDEILSERPSISIIPINYPIRDAFLRPRIFMEFTVQDYLPLGKLVFELYRDVVPKSVDKFLYTIDNLERKTFIESSFYKIIPQEYCEIGDHPRNIKKVSSIFRDNFPQENFVLQHSRPGVLSLVPTENGTNNLQFSITFKEYRAFDGNRVVIGKMIRGYKNLLKIQDFGKKVGKPRYRVYIKNCGIIGGRMATRSNTRNTLSAKPSILV